MTKEQQAIKWLKANGYKQIGGQTKTKLRYKYWRKPMRGGGIEHVTIDEVIKFYL